MPELTVLAGIDSYMDAQNADTNYGAAPTVQTGIFYAGEQKAGLYRAIGNFDVSPLAGTTILAAEMRRSLTLAAGPGAAVSVYRCTRPTQWIEMGVTWNKYDGSNDWTAGGGDYDGTIPTPAGYTIPASAGNHVITNLEAFVEDALNNRSGVVSVIHRLADEGAESTTREIWHHGAYADPSLAWRLVVTYEPVTARPRRLTTTAEGGRRPQQPGTPLRAAVPRAPRRGHRPHTGRRPSPAEGRMPWDP